MSMHLHHPSLSLTGKSKKKQKFRSAEEARKARELDASWKELQAKWGVAQEDRCRKRAMSADTLQYKLTTPAGRETAQIKSLDTGLAVASLAPAKVYTGSSILGISTLHKSNAVPVFSKEEAIDISKMRR